MHKDIRTALPGDKAKALGVIKPFYLASFFIAEKPPTKSTANIPLQKAGSQQSGKKKIARELASRPIVVQDFWPCLQSDMLNYQIY